MSEIEKSLGKLAEEINQEHQAFRRAFKATYRSALRAGDLLNEAKEQAGHGNWAGWVADNCAFSMRTAQVYMRLASNREAVDDRSACSTTRSTTTRSATSASAITAAYESARRQRIPEKRVMASAHGACTPPRGALR